MTRHRSWWFVVLVAIVLAGGCGIDAIGQAEADGGASPDGAAPPIGTGDASVDAPPVVVACGSTDTTCTSTLAPGFEPVTIASEGACPKDFESLDVVSDPSPSTGACGCACAIDPADPPSCAKGSFVPMIGSTTCDQMSNITYVIDGTGCTSINTSGGTLTIAQYSQIQLFPFHAGKCTTSAVTDATKVVTKPLRVCRPPPNCEEDVCRVACIAHEGDVACPGAPFEKRTLVGAKASLACDGCTTCANAGTCAAGTFRFYSDAACATEVATRIADGTCHSLASGSTTTFQRIRYDVPVQQPKCQATSTPTANVTLDAPTTVCCR